MIIHKLEIQNFKSYNGNHSFGPFDSHFTCVIGPNGNGKSNIIDAVLFVFGFKSSKLRQDNLSALIHKSAFARPDQATVCVVFKQENCLIHVSRTIFKSGHSYYKLNGEKIGWTELRQKLISKKIDLNKNLFIILQGQVQRLCQLSPQKMVEYLEFVSGSDQYKEPIDEAERQFIAMSISKQEVRVSLNVKRKVYDRLKEQVTQQATWIMLKVKVMLFQHLVLKKMFFENHSSFKQLQEWESEQIAACEKIESEICAQQENLKKKKNQLKMINAQCSKGELFIQQIQHKVDAFSLKIKEANREVNFIIKDKEKKQGEKDRIASEIDELGQISKQYEEFVKKNSEISSQLKNCREINKLKICMELQEKLKDAQMTHKSLLSKYSQDRLRFQSDRQKLKIYELKYKENKETIIDCKAQLKEVNEEIQQIGINLANNEEVLLQIERQLSQKPNEKIMSNQQKIINQIRSANNIKLICNDIALVTLRELIIIEAVYAGIVETILPHLDFFIVNTVKQAKEILDYLNKKKLGRMTILIRQSINEATKDILFPNNSPKQTKFLYEVCKCTDLQTKKILYWALGSTLVTNKLDIAMKVAYYDEKKYRVITMNGQLIDSTGTITKLSMKNGNQRQDEELLLKKQAAMKRSINSLCQRKKQLEAKKEQLQTTLLTVQNQERSLDGLDQVFLQQLQGQLKETFQQSTKCLGQITQLSDSLSKLQAKINASGFKMTEYDKTLLLLKQYMENEAKVKKIQNSRNIHIALERKMEQIYTSLKKMSQNLQQKIKVKSVLQTEKMKLVDLIQTKNKQMEVIQYGIGMVQAQIKEIQGMRKTLQDQLGDSNRKSAYPQPREELKKVRAKIKSAELQKLELLSKLFESIKQIKEFSFIIYKTLYSKCPSLVLPSNPESESPKKQINLLTAIQANALVLGKKEYQFTLFLNQKQKNFLYGKVKQNGTIYCEINDVRPSEAQADLLFESLASKQVKFGHSFEMEKIKHFQKELTKADTAQYQVDFQLFDEYVQKKKEFEVQSEQLNSINQEVQKLKSELIELRNKRLNIFLTSFNEINVQLNKIYMQLTGGRAQINLTDSMNPFEGIEFSVRPVNKSWKRVNLLSGGQKTFTSLALIFACEQIKKFPFYFMDEIDAALDYKNTTLLAQYITSKKGTQHIVISLRKNMYQQCHRVVGIYKIQDQSRKIEMNMDELRQRDQNI